MMQKAKSMPDAFFIGSRVIADLTGSNVLSCSCEVLDSLRTDSMKDTVDAAHIMEQSGVSCVVVLGGDGTSRAASMGLTNTPLLPVSTGTNNVYPDFVEGTVAGMFADFAALGFEAVADVSAKFRYNSGGKNSLSIVWLCPEGAGARSGCQHSQCIESWFANVPGLKIAAPTTPGDVRAFLRASIEDPDPVLFCFHKAIFGIKEDIPDTLDEVPSLKNAAKIVKPGSDLTVVAYHRALLKCLEAAEQVEKETGKTIEIIDPRVLIPFDKEALYKSVKKTGRLLVSHEAPERGGFGAQIIAYAMEECAGDMKSNPVSICGKNIPIPWGTLEDYALPSADDIKAGMYQHTAQSFLSPRSSAIFTRQRNIVTFM